MPRRAIIVGAGGHASVIADALLAAGDSVMGFTDSDATRHGSRICDCPILGTDAALADFDPAEVRLANGLGPMGGSSTGRRRALQDRLESGGWTFLDVRHPTATVSAFAVVHPGVHLLAACVVQTGAVIGANAVVNTAAIVEHGTVIGAWVHLAPGAVVCGDVVVGAHTFIGAGAVVRNGIRIGADCLIGAGAVVVHDIPDGSRCIGNPARASSVRA